MRDRLFLFLVRVALGNYPRWQRRWAAWLLDISPWLTRPREW